MIQLRAWQRECVNQALHAFESQNHFLCHATPGAGKTVMVAFLAKILIERAKIDFVLCFSPSKAVSQSVAVTFSQVLGRSFNGRIGAVGGSFTYQSMNTLPDDLWRVLCEHRVFVVLDEIHHCAGSSCETFSVGNSWGRQILDKIKGKASFSIALSGTPWRTDDAPIVLSRYNMRNGNLCCDYEYSLGRAVAEGVCRAPNIVLTDNHEISLTSSDFGQKTYSSIRESIEESHISYPDFLFRDEVIDYTLSEASKKLIEIRRRVPDAAGLVVAATVVHAEQIAGRLSKLGESPVVVNYSTQEAHKIISSFRRSSDRWIVSVGMISEGTDIPRLQVCCHLSRIRTELHFRQVLGRILRRQTGEPSEIGGWLYVLAEQNLTEFAHRIGEDLPERTVVSFTPRSAEQSQSKQKSSALLQENDFTTMAELDSDSISSWSNELEFETTPARTGKPPIQ